MPRKNKIKSVLILFMLLISFILTSFASIAQDKEMKQPDWTIDGNKVYTETKDFYLSAEPHTLSSSGWVTFEYNCKTDIGNFDLMWGFDKEIAKPSKTQNWEYYEHFYSENNWIIDGYKTDKNGTKIPYGHIEWNNYSTMEWDWKDIFTSINKDKTNHKGFDNWYSKQAKSSTTKTLHKIRAWINIPFGTNGKYWFCLKPTGTPLISSIAQNKFYTLDPWWDSDWSYYKTCEVSDKIDDYQMKIIIDKDNDFGGNVSCEGHCQDDFDDIRFVYNNITELPYWRENYTSGIQGTFWVNNSGNYSSFEMFYGNAGVSTTSDGRATFTWFDSIEDGNTSDAGDLWVTGSNYADNTHVHHGSYSLNLPSPSGARLELFTIDLNLDFNYQYDLWVYMSNDSLDRQGTVGTYDEDGTPSDDFGVWLKHNAGDVYQYKAGWIDTGADYIVGWNHIIIRDMSATTFDLVYNDVFYNDVVSRNTVVDFSFCSLYQYDGATEFWADQFIIRKYADPEPFWSSFGSEQLAMPITLSNEVPTDGATGVNLTQNFRYNNSLDMDENGVIDTEDIYDIVNHYGETGAPGWIPQDVNKDGEISVSDISMWSYIAASFYDLGVALAINVTHLINTTCNATFYTNATGTWISIGYESLLNNETANCTMFDLRWNTTYWWRVNVTDNNGNWTNSSIFSFTTAVQEFSITYAYPNNTHLTPDPFPEYFQINITSLVNTTIVVYFMTNASGTWEIFDIPTSNIFSTTHTLISYNTSWCSFDKNNFWSANVTSFGLWHNETLNFTTDRCYQIFSYDEVYTIDPIIKYTKYGLISGETNAMWIEDAIQLNLNSNNIPNQIKSIEILYSNPLKETELRDFKIRCISTNSSVNPANYLDLYVNGVQMGTPSNARMVDLNSHRLARAWDPAYNPLWSGRAWTNPEWYLEWYDINQTVKGTIVFEIVRNETNTTTENTYILFFPAIDCVENIHWTGVVWLAEDEIYACANDGLIKNGRIHEDVSAPNGVWDGDYINQLLVPGPEYTSFRWRSWVSVGATPFDWKVSGGQHFWETDAGFLYEFNAKRTVIQGERILPDTEPKNNSLFVGQNPDLTCYIITNLSNFTRDMNPVFVRITSNATDGQNWTEIWNNTGNYSIEFPSEGTFTINSSQYNCSFDYANATYYWNVSSRKLSIGAEWVNRTFNFRLIPVIANFTYTKITNNSIQFNSTSTGDIDYYTWDFGDGSYGHLANPTHYFHGYGDATITLCVENELTGYTNCYSLTILVGEPDDIIITQGPYGSIDFSFIFPFLYVIILIIIILWFVRGLDQFEEDIR